jgi:hypothetical protein
MDESDRHMVQINQHIHMMNVNTEKGMTIDWHVVNLVSLSPKKSIFLSGLIVTRLVKAS